MLLQSGEELERLRSVLGYDEKKEREKYKTSRILMFSQGPGYYHGGRQLVTSVLINCLSGNLFFINYLPSFRHIEKINNCCDCDKLN